MTFAKIQDETYLIFSESYKRQSEGIWLDRGSKLVICKFNTFYADYSAANNIIKRVAMPVMIEQIWQEGTALYACFESAAEFYMKGRHKNDFKESNDVPSNIVDRILPIDFMKILM